MRLLKAHAFGNDFLLAKTHEAAALGDAAALARAVCARHSGLGGDGLMLIDFHGTTASMRLLNADGSPSEISGNGLRCLAAWMAFDGNLALGTIVDVHTDAGMKRLELLAREDARFTFRAAMGQPASIDRIRLSAGGEIVDAVTLRVGNPQCVVLGEVSEARLRTVAAALAIHPHFPEGTNVELARVVSPDRVEILIWERGVGPTEASGTGACAAAVAAHRFGGASRDVHVSSPGGTQRVEWLDEGLYLTGWAEIIADATWIRS
jgi:diaminopimelate epimerase